MARLILCFTAAAASVLGRSTFADTPALTVNRSFKEAQITRCLAVGPVGRYSRTPFVVDPIEASFVSGRWTVPSAGTELELPNGRTLRWQELTASQDGWVRSPILRGGYAFVLVSSEQDQVVLLDASGHSMVYANGEPRVGDPYQTGYVRLPMQLRRGTNQLLFHCTRGQFRGKLVKPRAPVFLDVSDATVPDLVVGQGGSFLAAVVVVNAKTKPADQLLLNASCGGAEPRTTPLPPMPALTIRKVGFELFAPPQKRSGAVKLNLQLKDPNTQQVLDSASLELRVRRPEQPRKITFRSSIDNSVQYYALTPAEPPADQQTAGKPLSNSSKPLALVLSLHGAAVEAIGQAEAYSPKSWAHIVAPTNRRPYGFDWEDWGRLDALEVLELAQKSLGTDPHRVYLTGHSMGGHGTWNLAANCPDRFAAIGPSAGWISFWSYGGAPRQTQPSPIEELLQRCTAASDTLALSGNYVHHGVYILHGEADDNVPVTEARTMRQRLEEFHRDFIYHEQPGAGHWWDLSDEPGADCVDWAPMFDMFARHIIPEPESVRRVRFTTVNPGVSSSCRWAVVEAQIQPLKPSTVDLQCDP
ncbi:MAG: prolyl oligopeptidase family serine peptidase, partial [Armatimonadota bacterium]